MKDLKYIFIGLISASFMSCEETIDVNTEDVESSIVIDAFIDNRPERQWISVTLSRNFDDNTAYEGVSAEEVYIEDLTDPNVPAYVFSESNTGLFEWIPPSPQDSFGIVGHDYRLNVVIDGTTYTALSTLNPVPVIDSMRFNYEEESAVLDERFEAEFFATDLPGIGDTYWVRTFKNDVFLDQPEYLITSFDGTFSQTDQDGMLFIPPIRSGINPLEEDEQGYDIGDKVNVELLSITEDGYTYLNEIVAQTNRPGGISELFSVPITNLTGNIQTVAGVEEALGFFSTSSISTFELVLTSELADDARAIAKD